MNRCNSSDNEAAKKIFNCFFAGFFLTPDFKNALYHSKSWKLAKETNSLNIIQITHQAKEYVGIVLEKDQVALEELRKLEFSLKEQLQLYCDEYSLEVLNLSVFSQKYVK